MRHPRIMQKQWSLDEVQRLRELARQQLPLIVIARKLGKSPSAVASKAVRERISLAQKSNTLKTCYRPLLWFARLHSKTGAWRRGLKHLHQLLDVA